MSGIDELRGICGRWVARCRVEHQPAHFGTDFQAYCRGYGFEVVEVGIMGDAVRTVTAWTPDEQLVTTTVHG